MGELSLKYVFPSLFYWGMKHVNPTEQPHAKTKTVIDSFTHKPNGLKWAKFMLQNAPDLLEQSTVGDPMKPPKLVPTKVEK